MLDVLHNQVRQNPQERRIFYMQADAASLPFSDSVFDMAAAAHFFYFLAEWKKAAQELLRVVRQGRPVILMHTGTGMELPFLNDRYAELCAGMGHPIRSMGVKSTKEVTEFFCSLGCTVDWVRDRWQWTAKIPLGKAIDYIRRRAYSFSTFAPEEVHQKAVGELRAEMKAKFGDLNREIKIPNQVYLALVHKY
jgi:SAM-dependent methyltransferase